MRKKIVTSIFLIFIFWFLIVLKINYVLYNSEENHMESLQNSLHVTINSFKIFYRPSIIERKNNEEGEYGKAVIISDAEKDEKERRYNLHKFNELASSKISLLRKLPEKRRDSCLTRIYPKNLPSASIIIIYHNEAFSTLVRTVHTAISRSPHHLVIEVILVDDHSNYEKFPHLLDELDAHFKDIHKVKIIRSDKRIGLTVARLLGAKSATGDVLIFLDSHCECADGWLEPLLLSVMKNPRSAITPIIEVINHEDFSIPSNKVSTISVGSFTWNGDFTWHVPKNQDTSDSLLLSPTMAGGLFAIGREYFFRSGGYDDQMTYWGGENIEMSFRLWMCGDGIFTDPCSIVGHVFRKNSPHDMATNSVLYNKLRAVEVWMDDYKKVVYDKIHVPHYLDSAGNLDSRRKLRHDLGCKNFSWYLKNIATFIRIPGKMTDIENKDSGMCLDGADNSKSGNPVKMIGCHKQAGNQAFEVDRKGLIIFNENCLDLASGYRDAKPTLYSCHFTEGNQKWLFLESKMIKHQTFQLCLTVNPQTEYLTASECDINDPLQKFEFSYSDLE